MTDNTFVQVPPNSTGVKVGTLERTELHFDNITGTFHVGDTVTGVTSNATGEIESIELATDGLTGSMYLGHVTGTFVNDENLQVSAATIAVANITTDIPSNDIAYQKTIIADPKNPNYMQKIDRFGATVNTFSDGDPSFGSFGTLTVGEPIICKTYDFQYSNRDDLFWDQTAGAGTTSFEGASGNCLMQTGTASGDKISRTSHYYHHYFPSSGTEVWITQQFGDSGKTNLRRRWGYFDDDNGIFWELDGTTLYAVIRSDVSGSVVERRVMQSDFSNDTLDSADPNKMQLDWTAPNIFVIDFQFLGAGRVRFAVIDEKGAKVVAHVFENVGNGSASYPYMRTGSLPLRFEQENTGAVVSTSQWRSKCCAVRYTQKVVMSGRKGSHSLSNVKTITQAGGETLVVAYRPGATWQTLTNRVITKIINACFSNITNTGGSPVVFKVKAAPDSSGFTNSTFGAISSNGPGEVATDGTVFPAGHTINTYMVTADSCEQIDFGNSHNRDTFQNEFFLNADGTTQQVVFITAECLSGTNADVFVAMNYEEIE